MLIEKIKVNANRFKRVLSGGKFYKNALWRIRRTKSDLPILFIVGAPRSGTTLLQRIITTHSRFFSIEGETGIFTKQNIFSPNRKHFGLPNKELMHLFGVSKDISDFFVRGIIAIRPDSSKTFVEKTPQHALSMKYISKSFPNAKFLHVIRDPRDAFVSAKKHTGIPYGRSANAYAVYWKKIIRSRYSFERNGKTDTSRIYDIKYEELTKEPRKEVQKIMKWLGEEFEESQLDPKTISKDKRSSNENFTRLSESISNRTVGSHVELLTEEEMDQFSRICREEMELFGYKA